MLNDKSVERTPEWQKLKTAYIKYSKAEIAEAEKDIELFKNKNNEFMKAMSEDNKAKALEMLDLFQNQLR